MNILINCSNLRIGGGLQVAHSFLYQIRSASEHRFVVVLSSILRTQITPSDFPNNFVFIVYDINPKWYKTILGFDSHLSTIETKENIDVVFSVFGPTYWKPKSKHIVGYAKPQYVYGDSPFFKQLSLLSRVKLKVKAIIHLFDFSKNSTVIITENADVSKRLRNILTNKQIETVTNCYNQVFDTPSNWIQDIQLPTFDGITLLTVSANYPHKNLSVIPKVIESLNMKKAANLDFRFVVTLSSDDFDYIPDTDIRSRILTIGKVGVAQCPSLYKQCDYVFLPTLLECFTATYPEAMRMEKPLLTSNLNFATGLCEDAALYFNPLDPDDIADKILMLATNPELVGSLIHKGKKQLKEYDTYIERAQKYLNLITA